MARPNQMVFVADLAASILENVSYCSFCVLARFWFSPDGLVAVPTALRQDFSPQRDPPATAGCASQGCERCLLDDAHGLAIDKGADVVDDVGEIVLVVLPADIAEMGRDHDIVHAPERMIERQRLDVEHVEAGAGNATLIKGRDQRLFLDDRTARGVDEI